MFLIRIRLRRGRTSGRASEIFRLVTYLMRFIFDSQASSLMDRLPRLKAQLNSRWLWLPTWFIKKLIVTTGCVFGFLPFALLTFERWFTVKIY